MATLIPNDFTSYELTEEEMKQGSILTIPQKQVIQNYLSDTAIEKNNLELDPTNPIAFAQQEASLKGQMQAFRLLLDSSQAMEENLNQASINLGDSD